MSRWSRSWAPLSWGWPGRPRSKSIPSATHQIERRLSPRSPCTLAKGEPLSLRMACGKPCRAKSCSKLMRTVWLRAFSSARTSRTYRLCSSRTVKGSHRRPRLLHHPLKSTVHTSLGCPARRPLLKRPASLERRRCRRFSVKPARSSTRLKVLSLATFPCRRKYNSRILRGPSLDAPASDARSRRAPPRVIAPDCSWADAMLPPSHPDPPAQNAPSTSTQSWS
jgi:hypothetical protein